MQESATGRHEYRMKGWLRGLYLLLGLFSCGMGIFFAGIFSPLPIAGASAVIGIPPLAIGMYLVAMALRSRLVFDGARIEVRGAFSEQSADRCAVEGYRTYTSRNGTYWKLLLKQGRGSITIQNWFNCAELRAWFQQMTDLDEQDRMEMLSEIEQNQELGASPEDRLNALQRAKRWSMGLSVIAVIAAVGLYAGGMQWRLPAAIVLALTPVAALYLLNREPLLFALAGSNRDPRADLNIAPLAAGFGLSVFSGFQTNFVSLMPLLPSTAVVALAFIAGFYMLVRNGPRTPLFHVIVLMCALFFGAGLIATGDTLLDRGQAATYQVQVIGKHINSGRLTFYYLDLNPWGPYTSENPMHVPESDYQAAQLGDVVCLELHPGFLHAAWYERIACTAPWGSPATL